MPATRRQGQRKEKERFPVVGIGASAGGLRAIQRFFDELPADTGMTFVVIVHLDPQHKSQMAQLVQSHTTMPVSQPGRSLKLEPNRVYIIPPDKDFALTDGHIRTSPRSETRHNRAPIDMFFRTLAETQHSRATAIVMSGTGSDGTKGISFVKQYGGITMAQDPLDAEFGELPNSAISTGDVDIVLPIERLAAETARVSRLRRIPHDGDGHPLNKKDHALVGKILGHVRSKTGHDFSGYRRSTVMRRLERRMHFTQSESLSEYMRQLTLRADEANALLNDLLITVTSFFRDPAAFESLEKVVLPRLFAEAAPDVGIRVWVPGCATGEEAYSLAILLCEYAERLEDPPQFQIFATDLSEKSFAFARSGFYPESIVADVSTERLDRFFTREPGGYRIKKQVREKVLFATHDILRDPPFSRLDLISCRNLLIYLGPDAKDQVASVFHFALRPGGYLMLGTSEGVGETSTLFTPVDRKQRIFQAVSVPRRFYNVAPHRELPDKRKDRAVADPSMAIPSAWGLHQELLEAYASPSLLVNEEGSVIHFSSRVGAFLQRQAGEPSHKLLDMLPRSIRPQMRTLLSRAFMEAKLVRANNLSFNVEGKRRLVDIMVRPLESRRSSLKVALVLFEERPPSRKDGAKPSSDGKKPTRPERQMAELRKELQETIDEHEALIEEARAANEELQSINEEQRANSEELETSKEELQSLNEELRTLNQEFRNQNEQLGQTNSDLENLINSTDVGTVFLDAALRVRRFTPLVREVFNFVPADIGRVVTDVTNRLRYPELVSDAQQVLRTLARVQREVIADDGRWFSVRLSPYRADDRVEGVVMTMIETTDRKHAEIERELLLRDAESANVAKTNFIGVMSHELRTPLTAIIGYADIINAGVAGAVSEDQEQQLHRISDSAMHLAHLLDDALEAARLDSGSPLIRHDHTDIAILIREITDAIAPLAAKRGLALKVDIIDEMSFDTDVTKVRQILFNLLANAVRFTDRGSIEVRARLDNDSLVVSVADTGIGIAPEHQEKIFERFWQVDQTKTRTRGGTGLGLLVCRGLARQLGGEIIVASELGRGSTFTLKLPRE
ncbi:MAG TPA: CheR family methyltransferase [Gemmatimonadaceae bacterium]|nr:CheR family methyltransferase [Gemmatimonadaceae bacterium]